MDQGGVVNDRIVVERSEKGTRIVIDGRSAIEMLGRSSQDVIGEHLDFWIGKAVKEHNLFAAKHPELGLIPVDA